MRIVDYSIVAITCEGLYLSKDYTLTTDINDAKILPNEKCWRHDTKWYVSLRKDNQKFYKQKIKDVFENGVSVRTVVLDNEKEEIRLKI
jgi:hypothetical protein